MKWGKETIQDEKLDEFKKKREYIMKQSRAKRIAVNKNFPFTKPYIFFTNNQKRTTPKWVVDILF